MRIISQPRQSRRRLCLPACWSGPAADGVFRLAHHESRITQVVSSDPERVRLSLDPKATGSGQVNIDPAGAAPNTFKGFASEGTASLAEETSNGWKAAFPVYLFASTWRAARQRLLPGVGSERPVSLDHPRAQNNLKLEVVPQLVDGNTGITSLGAGPRERGATDPFYVKWRAPTQVLQPLPPEGILSEADARATITSK